MSEEKIIQHSANALHALQQKETGWAKKLKEFFVEILIIVFAVSITLVLHNWNDNAPYFQENIDYYQTIRQQLTIS